MDTSKEYIKMCRQSEEIQEGYEGNGRMGDFVHNWAGRGTIVIREWTDLQTHQNTWLPRQDQLQEMVLIKSGSLVVWMQNFYKFVEEKDPCMNKIAVKDISMEQLWLAFVMKEKYNKVWNGEDWQSQK